LSHDHSDTPREHKAGQTPAPSGTKKKEKEEKGQDLSIARDEGSSYPI